MPTVPVNNAKPARFEHARKAFNAAVLPLRLSAFVVFVPNVTLADDALSIASINGWMSAD